MTEQKRQEIFKSIVTLKMLSALPTESQKDAEKLRDTYIGLEKSAKYLLPLMGVDISSTYPVFLKREVFGLYVNLKQVEKNKNPQCDFKEQWKEKSLLVILVAIMQGHNAIDISYKYLKNGNNAEFASWLGAAGVYFGKLAMVIDLCEMGVYDRIGSIKNSLTGAALGGTKSGATRRKQSRVPPPDTLRNEQKKLLDAGKPPREVSAMLASKYGCTTDHIRKLLKRD